MNDPNIPLCNPLLKLDNQLCFSVYALSRLITKTYQPLLDTLGVTYPQYLVLLLLWEHESLTVKELGEKLLLDSGTLTPLLKRMEQRGWLSRRRATHDERSVIATLQPAGRALEQQAQEIPVQLGNCLDMTIEQISDLRQQLKPIISQLNK
ncbi:MarR family transcriptional regulator [Hymenobacter setariae]|uniref:MarR family transcriptional regulator n=1 Tax=Hymenobacter setariae TaxID=2594794 RepID=A0A558BMG8_9BACT|nr:MarR family transcriptional regulator [Hymenobacter setariae]TVT37690.1 MarR family transcriptional regulator [Hymenobacter setariae]